MLTIYIAILLHAGAQPTVFKCFFPNAILKCHKRQYILKKLLCLKLYSQLVVQQFIKLPHLGNRQYLKFQSMKI